jgi:hypothetical protein
MSDNEQDSLSRALLRLEQELMLFGTVRNALKEAHEKLTTAGQEWEKVSREQQQSVSDLVNASQVALHAANVATAQTKALTEVVMPLAKAIDAVNFPLRLDKIDMVCATQASTLSALQGNADRNFTGLRGEIQSFATAAGKRQGVLLILLGINITILTGLAILFLMPRTGG